MDESSSLGTGHKELNAVFDFIHELKKSTFPTHLKHKNTVIKYTKIPEFDFDSKATWSHYSYSSTPRLRRIITLDDRPFETTRSLKQDLKVLPKMSNIYPKRKIITIEDEDDVNNVLKVSKDIKKYATTRNSSKVIGTHNKDCSQRTTSRITRASKNAKESIQMQNIPKTQNINRLNEINKQNSKQLNNNLMSGSNKNKTFKDISQNTKKNIENISRISLSKNLIVSVESGKDASANRKKQSNEFRNSNSINKSSVQLPIKKSQHPQSRLKSIIDGTHKNKPVTVIHIPQDVKHQHADMTDNKTNNKIDTGTAVDAIIFKDTCVGTDPLPRKIDQITEIGADIENFCKTVDNISHTHFIKGKFDSLDIPKVRLKNERKGLTKKEIVNFYSASLPNLETPIIDIFPVKDDQKTCERHFHKSSSYIIGRATLTYRTERKIDFHVVGKNEEIHGNYSPSSLNYPLNVVSVFKKEFRNRKCSDNSVSNNSDDKDKSAIDSHQSNDLNRVNCSYVSYKNKLVKPSDIISTISVNNNLLQQSDFICEQFQRELNFIDSFFESLQYLERLSEKCFSDANFNTWIYNKQLEVNESEYISNKSQFENSTNVDDTETMASKSLCQLNLLIHNEQRRARDFLFVLKMQEDVLKDYIKSQMLWLEKKKKQDNIDISALKKKQRGALLKLQHECGEMQRMRKALLTLSEKRKVALMKTKKNIEMKLKNNVDVDQIIFGKKKLKRNTAGDRCLVPLKCFDLSSSGCEESTTSRNKSESPCFSALAADDQLNSVIKNVTSAEKSIQTGDSILATESDGQSTSTAAENCVVVDGGYLNILFHNLSLPQIFSSGKQYEVNEEALKNIVNSSNSQNSISSDRDVIEKFMDQIKNHDTDESSTPSTAHSLVEEFDQYYKSLGEEDKLLTNTPECENVDCEKKDCEVQSEVNNDSCEHNSVSMISMDSDESMLKRLTNVYGIDRSCDCEPSVTSVEIQTVGKEASGASVAGPLPVPAGAAAPVDTQPPDVHVWIPSQASNDNPENTTSDQVFSLNIAPIPYASPVHYEAEELRRQQLAIEREIKALEQQQCQLLVVREIPDKPPPPYTPPSESRTSKLPRMFLADSTTEEKIQKHFIDLANDIFDINDPFDAFVKDFCQENMERQRSVISDKPWDACNLLPQRPQPDTGQMVNKTYTELKEVLSGVRPTYISGVGSRRSDHIDDILFAEWRRCEPEWTSLHTDEAVVKNQLFESIFQKILIDTVDEYKKVVCCEKSSKDK
ncbi:unnamed protein product [Parnassius apollo]|uniref:(apollo) hypothetical protein n=1 Tax=Parnassius apollo TaxID=110799 RepID=A0A8S3W081_PARAO|nr:unnamed protein product [Parnassius apollo]